MAGFKRKQPSDPDAGAGSTSGLEQALEYDRTFDSYFELSGESSASAGTDNPGAGLSAGHSPDNRPDDRVDSSSGYHPDDSAGYIASVIPSPRTSRVRRWLAGFFALAVIAGAAGVGAYLALSRNGDSTPDDTAASAAPPTASSSTTSGPSETAITGTAEVAADQGVTSGDIQTASYLPSSALLIDTRNGVGTDGPLTSGQQIEVSITDALGLDAQTSEQPVAAILDIITMAPSVGGSTAVAVGEAEPVDYLSITEGQQMARNLTHIPLDGASNLTFTSNSGGQLIVRLIGVYLPSGATSAGRFVPVEAETVSELVTEVDGRTAVVDPSVHSEIPDDGVSAVVLAVRADVGDDGGQVFLGSDDFDQPDQVLMWPGSAQSDNRVRQGLAIVPVNVTETFEFQYLGGSEISISALGYFTDETAEISETGLFVPTDTSVRLVSEAEAASGFAVLQTDGLFDVPASHGVFVLNASASQAANVSVLPGLPPAPAAFELGLAADSQRVVTLTVGLDDTNTASLVASPGVAVDVRMSGYYLR